MYILEGIVSFVFINLDVFKFISFHEYYILKDVEAEKLKKKNKKTSNKQKSEQLKNKPSYF